MKVRVGVLGCGAVAQIMHLPFLRELDTLFEVVAVADAHEETLDAVASHYGIPSRCRDLDGLLEAAIDAVLILTPGSHTEAAIAAMRSGRHVFVEKPLAYTPREIDAIEAAASAAGTTLQVGYMKRYDPAYRRGAELARDLTDLRFVQITTLHPASELFWSHIPIRRGRHAPPSQPYVPHPRPIGPADTSMRPSAERDLLREFIGFGTDDAGYATAKVILTSLCHDVNALRGVLGEPTDVLACDATHDGGCIHTLFAFGPNLRCAYSFLYLPEPRDYREELAFYGGEGRVRIVFPSPFLRNMPTELFVSRTDDGAAAETRLIVSYEEAFKEELRAFHHNVTTGSRPETDLADARADLLVMARMARLAATPAR